MATNAKKIYKPTHKYELHLQSNTLDSMNIVGFTNGKPITNIQEVSENDLTTLMGMAMSIHNVLTDEYFRRNPEKQKEFDAIYNQKMNSN